MSVTERLKPHPPTNLIRLEGISHLQYDWLVRRGAGGRVKHKHHVEDERIPLVLLVVVDALGATDYAVVAHITADTHSITSTALLDILQ